MRAFSRHTLYLAVPVLTSLATALHGQEADSLRAAGGMRPLVMLGGETEDRIRLGQILGRTGSSGYLIRSPSSLTPSADRGDRSLRWNLVAPELRFGWNSAIPFSLNDGAMWAGRGLNLRLLGGARLAYGPVSLTLAPQVLYSENRDFQVLPYPQADRSDYASPWYLRDISADLPLRLGNEPLVLLDPGQSTLALAAGPVALGASTENQWWGPGIRNALVLSNHAAGIPHLFLRTSSPLQTPLGDFEGKWIAGALVESLYFDTLSTNDVRSLSAFALSFQPAGERNLTLGLARSVYAPVAGSSEVLRRAADVFTRWRPTRVISDTLPNDTLETDTTWSPPRVDPSTPPREQIFSLFVRWVFPEDGFETYAEWSRLQLPTSLRDFLTAPNHTQGYTLGLQWARPLGSSTVRLQGEVSYLEESSTFKQRPVGTYYTSTFVPQGYTHRGQVVGAGIGPGSSSQWAAVDYLASTWSVGLFGGRIRWNTDAFYTTPSPFPGRRARSFHAYDVSVLGGTRAGVEIGAYRLGLEFVLENRLNYLFQNPDADFTVPGVDVRNYSLELVLSSRSSTP